MMVLLFQAKTIHIGNIEITYRNKHIFGVFIHKLCIQLMIQEKIEIETIKSQNYQQQNNNCGLEVEHSS